MPNTVPIPRPKRWLNPFSMESTPSQAVSDAEVDQLLGISPFNKLNADDFRKSLSLRDILKNDTRRIQYDEGDLIVRRGDLGHSAFLVLSGEVHAEVGSTESSIPPAMLGRNEPKRRTLFESIAQLWTSPAAPETRNLPDDTDQRIGKRSDRSQPRIFLQDIPNVLDQFQTTSIAPGQWFGELSALGRTPRTATVFASGSAELLEVRWQGLRDLMRFDKQRVIAGEVETAFREHALVDFLSHTPMFRNLSDDKINKLVDSVEFQTYGEYDSPKPFKDLAQQGVENEFANEPIIFEEGHYPNSVFFVRNGLARLSVKHHHGHRTVGYLTPGQSYGFHEISSGAGSKVAVPYQYSLRAISFLSAVTIPSHVVESVLLDETPTPDNFHITPSLNVHDERETSPVSESMINFLVDGHYVQGTGTMVIDLDRCVRCDDCVRACATAHNNNPRFVRHGPVHENHMFANACLHCADPVCMVECPTGAIHRDLNSGHVVISEETCIGCAQCANNCSFDAIRMVQITDTQGHVVVDQKNHLPLMQATKCDFCIDQLGGPACQNACAHDALHRVDMSNFQTLEELLTR